MSTQHNTGPLCLHCQANHARKGRTYCSVVCATAARRGSSPGERRQCAVCGTDFFAAGHLLLVGMGKYCSKACYGMASRTRVVRQCLTCGAAFEARADVVSKGMGKYCSVPCAKLAPRKGEDRTCQHCQQRFYVTPSHIGKRPALYCSNRCAGLAKRSQRSRTCVICAGTFFVTPSQLAQSAAIYCSRRCMGKGMIRGNTRGRKAPAYLRWRKMVYERDNYTCQDCGKRPKVVYAHHIKSYTFYKHLAHVLSNGVTLCYDCHLKAHGLRASFHNRP